MRRAIAPLVATIAFASFGSTLAADAASRPADAFSSTSTRATQILGLGPDGAPPAEQCEAATGECLVGFIGYDRMTGSIDGNQVGAGTLSFNFATGTGWAVSLAHFSGTVRGCPGAGTATIRFEVQMGAEPGKNIGSLTVVAGSGKGGLAGLTGTGTLVATPMPDGSVPSTGTARLRCSKG